MLQQSECTLREVNISDNAINFKGMRALSHGMAANMSVSVLRMSRNPGMGIEGVAYMARQLLDGANGELEAVVCYIVHVPATVLVVCLLQLAVMVAVVVAAAATVLSQDIATSARLARPH